MATRRPSVHIAVPALIVVVLAVIALWRVGSPSVEPSGGETRDGAEGLTGPLTRITETLADNSVGRQATLERVPVQRRVGDRTFWVGGDGENPAFVVLDAAVPVDRIPLEAGAYVTLVGSVRPAPRADAGMNELQIDRATAEAVEKQGTYLHVTTLRRGNPQR